MRPENFSNLPVEERRTIIQVEITKIEKGNTHNTITSRRLRKKKAELANLDNPEALVNFSISSASTVSGYSGEHNIFSLILLCLAGFARFQNGFTKSTWR